MDKQILAALFEQGGRLISGFLQTYGLKRHDAPLVQSEMAALGQKREGLTTKETVQYQRREIVKELSLLEGHLGQGCKINSKPCDCCEKHPIKIEGLAEEAKGMSADPVFRELAEWTRKIAPITTEAASASGRYEKEYQDILIQAREFRKAIMPVGFSRKLTEKEVEHGEKIPAAGEEH